MSYSKSDEVDKIAENLDVSSERKIAGGERLDYGNITSIESIKRSKNSTYFPEPPNKYIIPSPSHREHDKVNHMEDNKLLEIYIEKIDKDQRDLKEDIRESERRVQKRVEDSERRFDEKMSQIVDMIQEQNQKMDKIEGKIETVSKDVSTGLNEYRKFMWGIAVSIFLAIAAMILTIILT